MKENSKTSNNKFNSQNKDNQLPAKYLAKSGIKTIKIPSEFINVIDTRLSNYYETINRELFLYFIALVEHKASMNTDKKKRYVSARLKAAYLKNIFGNKYKKIIEILIKEEILCRDYYIVGIKSYDYTINYGNLCHGHINEIVLSKSLQMKINQTMEFSRPTKRHLRIQYSLLKSSAFFINYEQALDWLNNLEDLSKNKYRAHFTSITYLHEKKIYVVEGLSSKRVFTNFTTIKKELRKFCLIDGELLIGIDLKSSQPYILSSLLLKEYPEIKDVKRFYEIVTERDIYNWLFNHFVKEYQSKSYEQYDYRDQITKEVHYKEIKINDRDDVKPEFMKVLFKGNQGTTPFQKILRKELSFVYNHIRNAKSENKNALAIRLQNEESKIFISAYKEMTKNRLKVLTVHDSIYCKYTELETVQSILCQKFNEFGYSNYRLEVA